MFQDESRELHAIIKRLRIEKGYTQKYVAEYLGVDVSTYAHYELARRTPDIKKLRMLAELYGLTDELLGAKLPIVAKTVYPEEMLDQLECAIRECPGCSNNYKKDKMEFDKLKAALRPVLEIRDNALDLPNIDLKKYTEPFSNQTIKTVKLDLRAEKLISECLAKQNEIMGW